MRATQPQGLRIVLTGASGGIGSAMARALAGQCEWIVLAGRDQAGLETLRAELGEDKAHPVCGDLLHDDTCRAIEQRALQLGGANLLINNAGAADFHAFETQDEARIRILVGTNLVAPMLLTRRLLPQLRRARAAQIINVGSLFGYIGYPGFAAYAASKAGLKGFTQALRRELADTGIKVRHFIPRATRTSINSPAVDALNREMRVPEDMPEAVAQQLIRFLAGSTWEARPGVRETLLVLLNHLAPALPDRAIHARLPRIQKHMPK